MTIEGLASRWRWASPLVKARSMPWVAFAVRRLLGLIVVVWALVTLSFLMVQLVPGDPARVLLGLSATPEDVAALRHQLGIDRPLAVQYADYWSDLANGDLGTSFQTGQPVSQLIGDRLGDSLALAGTAILVVVLVSIPLGVLIGAASEAGRRRRLDFGFTVSTSVAGSVPEFLLGTFLAFVFAVQLSLLPVAGSESWESLILPVAAVSVRPIAIISRVIRAETLNVLGTDYVRTVRSKRLPRRLLYIRHAFPNILAAALPLTGILFAQLIGGAVIVENLFARLGLGTALVSGILTSDYPVVQGIVLILGLVVVCVNTLVDLALKLADPRSLTMSG